MKKILFLIFILLSSFVSADLTTNNLGYYSFDNNGNLSDLSGTQSDATQNGAIVVPGKINDSYELNAQADNVQFTGSSGFTGVLQTNLSYGAWIKSASSGALTVYFGDDTSDGSFQLTEEPSTNKWACRLLVNAVWTYCAGTTITDTFTHVMCVWDKNDFGVKIYINGNLENTCAGNFLSATTAQSGTAQLGFNHATYFPNADIDEFSFWDRPISASEVSELYNNGTGFNPYTPILENLTINNQTYNMTSDGGCIAWRNDTSTNCNTTDGTPTFIFDTNRAADCSVRATQSSGDSFPAFNSSFACSTTGGTSHICTVFFSDRLLFDQNYLYASCTDGGNATSGSLAINMTAGSGGGEGLIDCISILGSGCTAVFTDDCAAIIK